MGIYSNNRLNLVTENVEPSEDYFGTMGSLQITIESFKNDHELFNAILCDDMAEAIAMNEGYDILNEGVKEKIENFKNTIIKYAKKAWEKIVGLYHTAIIKAQRIFIRDNKKFYDKYKDKVKTAASGSKLKDVKVKWAKPTGKEIKCPIIAPAPGIIINDLRGASEDKINEFVEKIDSGKLYEELVKSTIKLDDIKDTRKYFLASSEEITGITDDMLTHIEEVLTKENIIKGLQESKKSTDTYFKNMISAIKSFKTEVKDLGDDESKQMSLKTKDKEGNDKEYKLNTIGGKGNKSKDNTLKQLNVISKAVSVMQKVSNTLASETISAAKEDISQCKRVFAQAAVAGKAWVKESVLIEAVGDAVDYEIESTWEDYSM